MESNFAAGSHRRRFTPASTLPSQCSLYRLSAATFLEFVQQQTSQCVDETVWQEESKSNWLWVNCTEKVTVFQVQAARTQAAAQTVIDEEETGVVTTDRYPGYNSICTLNIRGGGRCRNLSSG